MFAACVSSSEPGDPDAGVTGFRGDSPRATGDGDPSGPGDGDASGPVGDGDVSGAAAGDGDTQDAPGDGDASGPPGDGDVSGPAGDGDSSGPASAGDGLTGTWDVIVTSARGRTRTATVSLSPTRLQVEGDMELLALIQPGEVAISYEGRAAKATRVMEGALDLGIMPLPLAGNWRFTGVPDNGERCDYALSPGQATLQCSDGVGHLRNLPDVDGAMLDVLRTEIRTSVLGQLAGQWSTTAGGTACQVTIEGSTIAASCTGSSEYSGSVDIMIDDDRVSGSSSGGIQFTAQRR